MSYFKLVMKVRKFLYTEKVIQGPSNFVEVSKRELQTCPEPNLAFNLDYIYQPAELWFLRVD